MGDVAGDVARQMVAAPVKAADKGPAKVKAANWLFKAIGEPTFVSGNGRQYPRTEGFGPNRKPHPEGGTNETIAFVTFAPFGDPDLTLEGRIYCERYVDKSGAKRRDLNVSLSFVKCPPRSASRAKIDHICNEVILQSYLEWRKSAPTVQASKATTRQRYSEVDS